MNQHEIYSRAKCACFNPLADSFVEFIHFPLVVGPAAIGIGIKQIASGNQEIALPFSDP
ncbi:MAG: hypothetical protein WA395_09120 [Nitrososphaeraceae archaeon]